MRIHSSTRWGLGDVLDTLILYLLATVVLTIVLASLGVPEQLAITISLTAGFLVMGGRPLRATARKGNGPRIDLGLSFRWSDAWMGIVGGLAAMLLGGLTFVLIAALTGVQPDESPIVDFVADANPVVVITIAVLAALIGPVAEEIFIRGLLWSALIKRGMSAWATLAITSAVFAVLHLEPSRFGYLLVAGLVLGWLRLRTGRLGASIVAHVTINALPAVALLLLS